MITRKVNNLKSKHLDISKIERKQLSIQFSLDGFSFSIFDMDLLEFIVFDKYEFNIVNNNPKELLSIIKKIFVENSFLSLKFEKVLVVHQNNLSSFVPFPIFDEDNLETYIKFNNKIYNTDFIVYDYVVNQDMVSVFVPYVNINNFLIDQYGSFEYKHYSSILVENLLNNYSSKNKNHFFVNLSKNNFEIIVSNNKKLLLYNTFEYKTIEDLLYYILFTFDQLNLNVEEVEVELLGSVNLDSNFYNTLYEYVRNITLLGYNSNYKSILEIDNTIQRENFCLFNTID